MVGIVECGEADAQTLELRVLGVELPDLGAGLVEAEREEAVERGGVVLAHGEQPAFADGFGEVLLRDVDSEVVEAGALPAEAHMCNLGAGVAGR